jgi:hypothetical protein
MEQSALGDLIDYSFQPDCFQYHIQQFNKSPQISPNNKLFASCICPSDVHAKDMWNDAKWKEYACTTYLGSAGTTESSSDGMLYVGSTTRMADVDDGTSHTLMIGERGIPDDLFWGWVTCGYGVSGKGDGDSVLGTDRGFSRGNTKGAHNLHFWSYHTGGGQFCYVDGSLRMLRYQIDHNTFKALGTRAGREAVVDE